MFCSWDNDFFYIPDEHFLLVEIIVWLMYGILFPHLSTSLGYFCPRIFPSNYRLGMISWASFTCAYQNYDEVIKWKHFPSYWSELLVLCAVNSPVTGEFTARKPVARALMFFYLCLNKRLSNHSRRQWLETPSRSLWSHYNERWLTGLFPVQRLILFAMPPVWWTTLVFMVLNDNWCVRLAIVAGIVERNLLLIPYVVYITEVLLIVFFSNNIIILKTLHIKNHKWYLCSVQGAPTAARKLSILFP